MEKLAYEIRLLLRIDDTESEVIDLHIERAIDYFKKTVSENFDFEKGLERQLLTDRVRYAYNASLEDFEYNFRTEIEKLGWYYASN